MTEDINIVHCAISEVGKRLKVLPSGVEGVTTADHLPGQGAKRREAEGSPSPENGFEIVNVDITIALQEPKLRPHIDAMRESLAQVMGIDKNRVSVKATTTERLGFVGRGEGCEVWATVLLAAKNEK